VPQPARTASAIRFGGFELDLEAGELRKNGRKLRVEGQPLQILRFLLETPGHVVTREQLQQALWPTDTFVDFEQGINSAIKRLRQALDDSADTPRFIETLPRRGYRFIYPLSIAAEEAGVPVRNRHHRWVTLVPLAGVAALTGVLAWLNVFGLPQAWRQRAEVPAVESLAVLRVENRTGDRERDYVADGIHEDLIAAFTKIGALRNVIARTSVVRYKSSTKPAHEIGSELGVDCLVEGSLKQEGTRLRLVVTAVDTSTDRVLWTDDYVCDLGALTLLANDIAADVADGLRVDVTRAQRDALKQGRRVEEAVYLAYRKGSYHKDLPTNADAWQAIKDFEEALRLDPDFAPAWARMGAAYVTLTAIAPGRELPREEALRRAKEALQRAIDLDPHARLPHQTLAQIRRGQGDWQGAAREYELARKADPGWLGPSMYLLAAGRFDEAVAASRQDAQADPLSYYIQLAHGYLYFQASRFDESIEQLRRTIRLDPANPWGHCELAWNYIKKGLPNEAASECDIALDLQRQARPTAPFIAQCGWVYAAAGRRRQALEIAHQLPAPSEGPVAIDTGLGDKRGFRILARIYDALGYRERALAYLAQVDKRVVPVVPPDRDPMFSDAMKRDPRFREWAAGQMTFPPAAGTLAEVRAKAAPVPRGPSP
jgi:TolB-like protein/DNA-binding winged helix-turn-helix (wHTH) protein/Tfp pilus assembly protein PilF